MRGPGGTDEERAGETRLAPFVPDARAYRAGASAPELEATARVRCPSNLISSERFIATPAVLVMAGAR